MQHFPLCKAISREFLQKELEFCQEKLGAMLPRFQDCFPAANTEELVYPAEHENFEWTTSFFSGMLWLLYEHTGDPAYLPVLGSTWTASATGWRTRAIWTPTTWAFSTPCPAIRRSCCGRTGGRRSASSRPPMPCAAGTSPRRASFRPAAPRGVLQAGQPGRG